MRAGVGRSTVEGHVAGMPPDELAIKELRPGGGGGDPGAQGHMVACAPAGVDAVQVPAVRAGATGAGAVAPADADHVARVDDLDGAEHAAGAARPGRTTEADAGTHRPRARRAAMVAAAARDAAAERP